MKFAKILFNVAGIWGVILLLPLYFIFDLIGEQDPPPITHPAFFYGFAGLGLAWQGLRPRAWRIFIRVSRTRIRVSRTLIRSGSSRRRLN